MDPIKELKKIATELTLALSKKKLYHATNIPPEVILKEGLIGRKSKGFSQASEWVFEEGWLPETTIFAAEDPQSYASEGKYLYEIDASDLELLPDYPTLVDHGAIIDDAGYFYWEDEKDIPTPLKKFHDEDHGIYKDEVTAEDVAKVTRTVAIVDPVPLEKIKLVTLSTTQEDY